MYLGFPLTVIQEKVILKLKFYRPSTV